MGTPRASAPARLQFALARRGRENASRRRCELVFISSFRSLSTPDWGVLERVTAVSKSKGQDHRPSWVKDAAASTSGSLVIVARTDGSEAGFRMSKTSLVEQADLGLATAGG